MFSCEKGNGCEHVKWLDDLEANPEVRSSARVSCLRSTEKLYVILLDSARGRFERLFCFVHLFSCLVKFSDEWLSMSRMEGLC